MRKIKLFLFGLFLSASVHALTLSQIRTEVRLRIKDSNSTRLRYSDTQINNLINEAHRDIVNQAHPLYAQSSISLSVGIKAYSVPSDVLEYYRALYTTAPFINTAGFLLPETSEYQLDSLNNNSNWLMNMGAPTSYYQDPAFPEDIFVYPTPSTTTELGTVYFWYVQKANTLSADGDTPFRGSDRYQDYSDLLIYYPSAVIFQIEGETDKATAYSSLYTARLQALNDYLRNHPNFIPGFAGQRR